MKVRVAVLGTIGKSVLIDTTLPARVAALETVANNNAVSSSSAGGVTAHGSLSGLAADDHPQYTMWSALENITAEWNFSAVPTIGGTLLDEYIQDTIGLALLDSPSIRLNYYDYGSTDGRIEAEIVDEFVQDLVGAMLLDSQTINFTYFDYGSTDGRIIAEVIPGGIDHGVLAGLSADDHPQYPLHASTETISGAWTYTANWSVAFSSPQPTINDTSGTGTAALGFQDNGVAVAFWGVTNANGAFINDAVAGDAVLRTQGGAYRVSVNSGVSSALVVTTAGNTDIPTDSLELRLGTGNDLRLFHDGTNSHIHNDTGDLRLTVNGNLAVYEAGPTTGTATAAMTSTNKPGANNKTQPDTWLPLDLDGTLYYVPCYLP